MRDDDALTRGSTFKYRRGPHVRAEFFSVRIHVGVAKRAALAD